MLIYDPVHVSYLKVTCSLNESWDESNGVFARAGRNLGMSSYQIRHSIIIIISTIIIVIIISRMSSI